MTPDELKAAMAICDAATPGPYRKALNFIVELMWDKFYRHARPAEGQTRVGWWDSCSHSEANYAADYLIALDSMEEHRHWGVGRRRFYRPIEKEKTGDGS